MRWIIFSLISTVIRLEIIGPSGSWRWLLPVNSLHGESERALEAIVTWVNDVAEEHRDARSALISPNFPHLRFLRACLDSDSMRNRARLFRISQQYERLWFTYRTRGFTVDPLQREWRLHNDE